MCTLFGRRILLEKKPAWWPFVRWPFVSARKLYDLFNPDIAYSRRASTVPDLKCRQGWRWISLVITTWSSAASPSSSRRRMQLNTDERVVSWWSRHTHSAACRITRQDVGVECPRDMRTSAEFGSFTALN